MLNDLSDWANLLTAILGVGSILGFIGYHLRHRNLDISIIPDRKSRLRMEDDNKDWIDKSMKYMFKQLSTKTYDYHYIYSINIKPTSNTTFKFISAKIGNEELVLSSNSKIKIKEKMTGVFVTELEKTSQGYSQPNFESHRLDIVIGYKTWKIIPHYIHYLNEEILQSYLPPKP